MIVTVDWLTLATSETPSPSKSPTARPSGASEASLKTLGVPKVPSPLPNKIANSEVLIGQASCALTTMSALPSPLKSPRRVSLPDWMTQQRVRWRPGLPW